MKARIVRMRKRGCRHLYWRGDIRIFVTLCDDGNVILDGRVMSLEKATEIVLKRVGFQASLFWE